MTLSFTNHTTMPEMALFFCYILFSQLAYAENNEQKTDLMPLATAIKTALSNNPDLNIRQAMFDASQQKPAQVGALPEPRLMINAANLPLDSFSLSQTPMTQIQIGISQAIPYPGKLKLRKEISEKESMATGTLIISRQQWLIRQVKHHWWQIFFIDRSLDTLNNNRELLSEFIEVAETKYIVGQGLQQEVLLAHVELAKLDDQQLQVEGLRMRVTASFNSLLNRHANAMVTITDEVNEQLPKIKVLSDLLRIAIETRPEIQNSSFKISASKSRLALAKKDYYPDFKLGAIYGWRQDRTGLGSIQFSMNLPLNVEKRQNKQRDQRKFELMQQKYSLDDLKNSIEKEIQQAIADYDQALKQTMIYQNRIIPQANQTVDSMLAAYQVNKVDFLNLLRSQITLFDFQTKYWQAFSRAKQALAAIDYAVGKEVSYDK